MSLRRLPNRRQCGETMNSIRTGCSISMDAACARDLSASYSRCLMTQQTRSPRPLARTRYIYAACTSVRSVSSRLLMEELHTDSIDGGSEAIDRPGHVPG
jgi:hypothetical protein